MNKENTNPPIKCGYCSWLIDGPLHLTLPQHSCFQNYDNETQLLNIDENNVASIIEKDQSIDVQASNIGDYNEALINAVYARPALYDHRIPIKERTGLKKKLPLIFYARQVRLYRDAQEYAIPKYYRNIAIDA